jgi:antitoxin component of MazEF toxin-antitoxin module
MTDTLIVKLEEIEGSLGFIIPPEIVKERGLQEGDLVQFMILPTSSEEKKGDLKRIIGKYRGTTPFEREKDDRY